MQAMPRKRRVVVVSLDKDVLDMLEACHEIEVLGLLDKDPAAGHGRVQNLGGDDRFEELQSLDPDLRAVIAVDPPHLRERLVSIYGRRALLTVVSPAARVSRHADIGEGTIVQSGAYVAMDVVIGLACKLNVDAAVHHDSQIGDYVTLAPGARILGTVNVGAQSYVGAGAIVLPHVRIGERVTIGAGAVVTKDVAPDSTVAGVPARNRATD